ncbi:MAG: AI-2E family transporter [Gemmatimonadales bacterium]
MTTVPLSPLHRAVLLAAGLVIIAGGLHAAASTVSLVLVSLLLAMAVSPLPYLLQRRGMKHGPAVLLSVLAVLVGGVLILWVLVVGLKGLQEKIPEYQAALSGLIEGLKSNLAERGVNVDAVARPDAERIMEMVRHVVAGSLAAMGSAVFALILVILILLEMPVPSVDHVATGTARDRFDEVSVSVRRYVALTGLIGLGQALMNFVVMLALGTDFAGVWFVFFFLLSFVPFGFAIGLVPPFAVTLMEQGSGRAGLLFGLLMVANLISDNVIKPKVMGKGLGLSPLAIVLSLMLWAFILGPMGAVLAIPLTIAIVTVAPLLTDKAATAA